MHTQFRYYVKRSYRQWANQTAQFGRCVWIALDSCWRCGRASGTPGISLIWLVLPSHSWIEGHGTYDAGTGPFAIGRSLLLLLLFSHLDLDLDEILHWLLATARLQDLTCFLVVFDIEIIQR